MKPLNLDNSPCSPISSNCVIWQGPDIECIKLCKGDTVSDVVFKLATELCEILEILDIKNYDLSCFNLTSCAPADFQALINFLIERICALENLPTPTPTPDGSDCPTDCIVQVAPCLATSPNQVMNLIDYVNLLATTICNILTDIDIINSQIINIDGRVTTLETIVSGLSNYTTPSFSISCDIGTLTQPNSYPINEILEEFINNVWCPMNVALVGSSGSASDLSNAIATQCTLGTDLALINQFTSPTLISIQYAGSWVSPAVSLADSIRNLWVALCDVRNAEIMEYEVTTTDDITVNTSVVGAMTTFEIGRTPKLYAYQEAISSIDLTTDPGFVDMTYFMPVAYSALTYTNTSGATKDFIVRVSYDTLAQYDATGTFAQSSIGNWVDGAITKNNAAAVYQVAGVTNIGTQLVDSVTNTVITNVTPETVVTTPSANPVVTSVGATAIIPRNVSFFKVVNLANGESVQLKFRAKVGNIARLLQAQIFVEEIR
jgi:DNA-binding protein